MPGGRNYEGSKAQPSRFTRRRERGLLRIGRHRPGASERGSFGGKALMSKRIVRLEGDVWRIRPEQGELEAAEQQELRDYFDEIRMPYRLHGGGACVLGSISWETLSEILEHFYDGRAEVYPF